jgi:hypothetical protein
VVELVAQQRHGATVMGFATDVEGGVRRPPLCGWPPNPT